MTPAIKAAQTQISIQTPTQVNNKIETPAITGQTLYRRTPFSRRGRLRTTSDHKVLSGKFINFNVRKHYGFISCPELGCIVYASAKEIKGHKSGRRLPILRNGQAVEFEIMDGKPHLRATKITGTGGKLLKPVKRSFSEEKNEKVRMIRDQQTHSQIRSRHRSSSI